MMLSARQRVRSRLRDGAAASAFAGVALSGRVPIWAMVIFLISLVLSFTGRHPLAGRRASSAILLVIAAVALFGFAFLGVLDLVVSAVAFAILVTAHRLLSETTRAIDQQVLLASLLLMAGGAALSGELWYSLCLAGFGICSCLHLGLATIEGPEEKDELLPVRPVMQQLSVGVALSLVAGVVFFFAFPRLSWNVAARRTSPSLIGAEPGMSDRVRMGGTGSLKTNARVVARITVMPDPKKERLDEYWPGRIFDSFNGREWTGSGVDQPPASPVHLMTAPKNSERIVQRIELLPSYQSRTLIALREPSVFSQAILQTSNGPQPTPLIEARGEEVRFAAAANGYTYDAYSRSPVDQPEAVLEDRAKFLALPETIDPRVAPLIDSIVGSENRPNQIANRLEAWLKRDFTYTLELPGEQPDPLADFLFVSKAGRCEHFAFTLAVALRLKGVPARVVAGYFGGERLNDRYVLRGGDAHAWTQAFIDGRGWVDFDATPDSGRRSQPTPVMATLVDLYERLEALWRQRVVDYSIQDQAKFVRDLVRPPPDAQNSQTFQVPWRRLFMAAGVGALMFAVIRLLQRRVDRRPHPATNFLNRIEQQLTRLKLVRADGEGLEELSARLTRAQHPLAQSMTTVTRAYLAARFGASRLTRDEEARLLALLMPKE